MAKILRTDNSGSSIVVIVGQPRKIVFHPTPGMHPLEVLCTGSDCELCLQRKSKMEGHAIMGWCCWERDWFVVYLSNSIKQKFMHLCKIAGKSLDEVTRIGQKTIFQLDGMSGITISLGSGHRIEWKSVPDITEEVTCLCKKVKYNNLG